MHGFASEAYIVAERAEAKREAQWLASWDRSTALRDKFQGDLEACFAFCRHEHR